MTPQGDMPLPRRILLLTEDAALARLLPPQLEREGGFVVRIAGTAAQAEEDAVLLDAALPPGPSENLALLGGGRPVILLGHAPGEARDAPLPAGAAERLPKPLRVGGLVPRLRARMASFEASPEAAIALGPFRFHFAARLLTTLEGARIRLTETEAAILAYLHRANGRAVPREELLGEVWGYSAAVATHTLETHVYRLRRKLGDAADLLRREDGGYRIA